MKLKLKRLTIIAATLAAAALAVYILTRSDNPPVSALDAAKSKVSAAAKAGAIRYAQPVYRKAEQLVQQGWLEIAKQNGKVGAFRDYHTADSILALASAAADEAKTKTEDSISRASFNSKSGIEALGGDIETWTESVNGSLARYKLERFTKVARLQFTVAQSLHAKSEFDESIRAVTKGNEAIRQLSMLFADFVDADAQRMAIWRNWVNETLAQSQNSGGYAVIVDKAAHKTHLIKAGRLIRTYDCELGYNSAHQKLLSGDGATPEGKYQVVQVKVRSSKYYKALLLDYPNDSDRQRFVENKRAGIISSRARIGGLIEIHGDGGKGNDWTEGCVALTNKDMDHMLSYVTNGTPVTIVRRSANWP